MIHQRTHPVFVEGCAPCRWSTVLVTPSAAGSAHASEHNAIERQKAADMEAYPRLLKSGVQPMHVGGAARMEREASSRFEIESGQLLHDRRLATRIDRVMADLPTP